MAARWCWKDLEATAQCPICWETLKDPKTLPCLHSFCLICLDNLASIGRRRHQDEIRCEICETSVPIPEENTYSDFPTSFHLDRFKEILTVFNGNQAAMTCMNCNEGKMAISYCFVCQDYLCSTCDEAHQRLRVTRDHSNILLKKRHLLDLLQRPVMCEQEGHEGEALLYYCDECSECICHICYDESHWRHDFVVDIQQAAREGKKRLEKVMKKAEEEITASEDAIKKSEDIFNSRKQEIGEARRNVIAVVKELIKNLKQHEKAVLTKIDDISEQQQQQRHAIKKRKLELFVTRLTSPVEHGKCVLKRNVDMEIVKEQKAIIGRCKGLLNSKETEALVLPFVNYAVDEVICQSVQCGPGELIVSNTDPSRCTARVKGLTESVVGRETKILVGTRDSRWKQCYHKDDQVMVKIHSPLGEELETASEDKSDGRYEFSFTPEFDGRHDVMISVNGRPLTVSSLSVQVSPCLYQKAFELGSNGQFLFPCGIAIDKHNGNVAVADSLNGRIQVFDSKGKYLRQFGDIRDSTKNLQRPILVEFHFSGLIIVIEECGEMMFCSKEGNFLNYVGYVRKPCSVSVKSNGDLIVCDSSNAEVKVLSPRGDNVIGSFAGDPVLDGSPSFAIHHQDRFFVSYQKTRSVKVFSDDGDFLYDIGTSRKANEQLSRPLGLAIDKFNNLIVCDSDGCRLQVFTLDGRHVTSIEGHDNGFKSPQFVAISKDGRLFITDTGKKCVHVFH